ncbi:MAG: phospholipase D family protein [Deltaproteobacteria bacterium]|nr:phospholipase D family protein [Deltaproteobacteria bacterium]
MTIAKRHRVNKREMPVKRCIYLLTAAAIAITSACTHSFARDPYDQAVDEAMPAATSGALSVFSAMVMAAAAQGDSGYLLVDRSDEALHWRLALIDSATQSVDVQYYLWKGDAAGVLLARRLIQAADRGVRVRMLVDDFLVTGDGAGGAAIAQHPMISIRLYNPWMNRGNRVVSRAFEWLSRPDLNSRMHNKVLVADNQVAIAGGRNLANEYFGLNSEKNFRDLDVVTVGPVVRDLSQAFDDYWTDDWAYPIQTLVKNHPQADELDELRERVLGIYEEEREILTSFTLAPRNWERELEAMSDGMTFGPGHAVADDPSETRGGTPDQVFMSLGMLVEGIQEELVIVSAYFVPGERLIEYFAELRDQGIRVIVLTNSLASNNHAIANSQYKKMRRKLVRAGVELYEMRHDALLMGEVDTPPVQSQSLVLHSKAVMVDRKRAYIGGLNLSPRGILHNTENGMLIEDAEFAEQLASMLAKDISPENSWRVGLDENNRLYWESGTGRVYRQPAQSGWQRAADWFFGLFPLANQI